MQELQCKTFQIWSNLENLVGAVLIYIYKVKKNAEISNNVCVIQITRKSMCTEVTKQISFRKFVCNDYWSYSLWQNSFHNVHTYDLK